MYSYCNPTRQASSPAPARLPSGSPIDEARNLVQRCAEPRPVGDSVKAAIIRASRRLGFSFSRTKDIWYSAARRIDAAEMDQLRRTADKIAMEQAIAGIQAARRF